MEIQSAMQLTESHGVKSLVYGPAGAGKTVLSSTMPNPIIISAESGLLSLRRVIKETGRDLPVLQIKDMKDLQDAYALVAGPQGQQFSSVVLDSISEIGEVCLNAEKRATKDGRAAYGEMATKMTNIVRDFRDLPGKHVLFTAKEETIKDARTGVLKFAPSMPGNQMTGNIPYFFDEVFRAFVGTTPEGERYHALQTALDEQAIAKDRSGVLDAVEYPDMSNIIAKITA